VAKDISVCDGFAEDDGDDVCVAEEFFDEGFEVRDVGFADFEGGGEAVRGPGGFVGGVQGLSEAGLRAGVRGEIFWEPLEEGAGCVVAADYEGEELGGVRNGFVKGRSILTSS
jgi:hypothetical protein